MSGDLYIGLMSGTSLDGLDAVLAEFQDGDTPRIRGQFGVPLPPPLRTEILALCHPGPGEIDRMGALGIQLAHFYADTVKTLLKQADVSSEKVRAIGCHGQTIRHRPNATCPFTLQIGDPSTLAEETGITVVAGFRQRDMAAGGQGAPLVPAFHRAAFQARGKERVIVNIGGMANITLLPADADLPTLGYDTGPGNILLDGWIQSALGKPLDPGGSWAASGTPDKQLLNAMLKEPFFRQPPPKSTGREQFDLSWVQATLQACNLSLAPQDIQATLTELTAITIADAIRTSAPAAAELYVCGGGAHNQFLLTRLQSHLPGCAIATTEQLGLAPDYVEATAFAWLARCCLERRPGNLPAVTGARGTRILGGIYPA